MEGTLQRALSQRLSSQEELRQVLREEQRLNVELLEASQALSEARRAFPSPSHLLIQN